MKKLLFYHIAVGFAFVCAIVFLAGCVGNKEIEIKVPPSPSSSQARIFVTGSIDSPGLYFIDDTYSLQLILQRAGGTLPEADLDQMRLYIPASGETKAAQKIDINRADAWLLAALPGIGDVGAGKIVAFRETNGLFRSISELARVDGIGETTLSKIQTLVTIAE